MALQITKCMLTYTIYFRLILTILIKYSNSALICLHFFPSSLCFYHHIPLYMLLVQKYIVIIITLHNLMSLNKIRRKEKKYIYTNFYICCCSVTKSCPTLCDPMDCSAPGFPVLHYLPEFVQTHGDAIQPSQPLLPPSPHALNLSQHQDLFQWVSSSHQMAKVLELQLQHQSFQWILRTYFL